MGVCGGVCMLVVGFLVWSIASRDTWELDNASRISAKLEEADRLQQSDPLAAYKTYDEVLKEAKQHKITDEQFAKKLANAEKSRTACTRKSKRRFEPRRPRNNGWPKKKLDVRRKKSSVLPKRRSRNARRKKPENCRRETAGRRKTTQRSDLDISQRPTIRPQCVERR